MKTQWFFPSAKTFFDDCYEELVDYWNANNSDTKKSFPCLEFKHVWSNLELDFRSKSFLFFRLFSSSSFSFLIVGRLAYTLHLLPEYIFEAHVFLGQVCVSKIYKSNKFGPFSKLGEKYLSVRAFHFYTIEKYEYSFFCNEKTETSPICYLCLKSFCYLKYLGMVYIQNKKIALKSFIFKYEAVKKRKTVNNFWNRI